MLVGIHKMIAKCLYEIGFIKPTWNIVNIIRELFLFIKIVLLFNSLVNIKTDNITK